ncbi:YncE family protein [Geomicrobium sp. JCM 19038]|uniref:YncE family protein n=1 Tax=Geomicrobium sp. JCM 19038 TaxID=1460635 RepID=UPI00045F1B5F|nr:YncE family protein [Geomicrobium sp. JCM 19038]GAK07884.1 hypothetical protein JCM19038_1632 [Geomicrobium sp. JCM 19038]
MSAKNQGRIVIQNNLINGTGLAPNPSPVPPPLPEVCSKLYVTNRGSNSVSVIDTATGQVIETFDLDNYPELIYVNNDLNQVVVSVRYGPQLLVIDSETDQIIRSVTLNLTSVDGVVYNSSNNSYYVASYFDNQILVVDATTYMVTGVIENITRPYELIIDPVTNDIYAPNVFSNSISVIRNTEVIQQIEIEGSIFRIAFNPETRLAYVTISGRGVGVINTSTNTFETIIDTAGGVEAIDVNPITNRIYATKPQQLIVIDGDTNTVERVIDYSGVSYQAIAINFIDHIAYVIDSRNNTVLTIDLASYEVLRTTEVGSGPIDLGLYYYSC